MRVLLVALIALGVGACGESGQADPSKAAPNPYGATPYSDDEKAAIAAAVAGISHKWTYRDDRDPMTDQLTRTACVTSSNLAQLDSPYRPVTADLCIRQSPRHGSDVFVALNGDGQIICRTYEGCSVQVRFGETPQQSFSATDAADGSSNIVFITNASRFINAAKSADTIRVQVTFYQAGDQVLEFPSKGLEWPRPPAAG